MTTISVSGIPKGNVAVAPAADVIAPTVSAFSLGVTGGSDMTCSFESDEQLEDVKVNVDSPSTSDFKTFDRSDFDESGTGPYTYSLSTRALYDDGDGTYTATLDEAKDKSGNEGANGQSDTHSFTTIALAFSDGTALTFSNSTELIF